MTIIDWNGSDLPAELRGLPAGTYILQWADHALTPDEEQGLTTALGSLRAGKGVSHEVERVPPRPTLPAPCSLLTDSCPHSSA